MVKRISEARIDCGHTIQEAARHANISAETLSDYEKDANEMPLEVAKKLLELYQVSVDLISFI
ncbi:hypothetical protein PMSD_22245 [Paenibacillus macquariensis subsp. defensor]|nr:hypothetical protein PMSD_22245 [Paenibacillus macquariensis subsp. defensor]